MKKTRNFLIAIVSLLITCTSSYSQDAYIGEIRIFAGTYAPKGWAFCDGRSLPIATNQTLYSIIFTTYGGDGKMNFALPDLRSRFPIGAGMGQGLTEVLPGSKGGVENITNTSNSLPPHTHPNSVQSIQLRTLSLTIPSGYTGQTEAVNVASLLAPPATENKQTGQNTGNNLPISIRNPYLGVNYIICLEGIYPPRN